MNNTTKARHYWIDVIRITAMVLIIFMHTPIPNVGTPGTVLSTLSFLTGPGVGLFLMISGALLLGNNMQQRDFLKRRFSKVLWPTLFWTAVYLVLKHASEPTSVNHTIKEILSIPFDKQGHGVLWFMYTLAGLYLLTPILSRWLKTATRHEVEFYLLLWVITLLYPYLKIVLSINTEATGILYYFTGYCGYFLLGYYLKKYVITKGINRWHMLSCVLVIFLCVTIVFVSKRLKSDMSINDFFWYLSLPMAMMSCAYFVLLSQIKIKYYQIIISKLSALSFGVFLIHILVMRYFLWNINVLHDCGAILHIPFIAFLTIVISWSIAFLISKLPFSKYIIGI